MNAQNNIKYLYSPITAMNGKQCGVVTGSKNRMKPILTVLFVLLSFWLIVFDRYVRDEFTKK